MKTNRIQLILDQLEDRCVPATFMLTDHFGGDFCDAEKLPGSDGVGEPTGARNCDDDLMCWAAAASNALEWTGWGMVNNMDNADKMFEYFQDHWTDDGGLAYFGWDWWFDGTENAPNDPGWASVDVAGAGFFPSHSFSSYVHEELSESAAMNAVRDNLRAGNSTVLGIYTDAGGGHAITVWGYDFNAATGAYEGVWVTDSDDDKWDSTPEDELQYYDLDEDDGRWYLQNYGGSNDWYVGVVYGLELIPDSLRPDLAHRAGYRNWFTPHTVVAGESFECGFDIKNYGDTESGEFYVDFYASTNSTISTADNHLGRVHVWSLSAGEATEAYLYLSDFPELAARDYYIGIIIDGDGDVRDFDESNNKVVETGSLLTVGRADLVGTYFNALENIRWGDSFYFDARIANQGNGNAGAFTVKFYLSANDTISTSDYFLGLTTIESLAAGTSILLDNHTVYLPNFPPSGFTSTDSVWIGMIIDTGRDVPESNESNNRNQGNLKDWDNINVQPNLFPPFMLNASRYLPTSSTIEPSGTFVQRLIAPTSENSQPTTQEVIFAEPVIQPSEALTNYGALTQLQTETGASSILEQSLELKRLDLKLLDGLFADAFRKTRK